MGRHLRASTERKSRQRLTACKGAISLTCQRVTVSSLARVNCENETAGAFANDFAYLALAAFAPAFARLTRRQVMSCLRQARIMPARQRRACLDNKTGSCVAMRHAPCMPSKSHASGCLDRRAGASNSRAKSVARVLHTRQHVMRSIHNWLGDGA